ncbi:unnamed protein product [Paramecium pentaurelia]|uniref:Uncharacterized protein n=1 Tax=Paramecium pentaurelia TaxID=43138 RepID=A0A8S1X2S1_9CILI|nr:unnamed protein product [Paramecium pentaurelia]
MLKKQKQFIENPIHDLSVCPTNKLTLSSLDKPLFPTPWRSYQHYNIQTPTILINQTDRVQEMSFQIDKLKPRYSRSLTKNRKQYLQETAQNVYDPKPMEKQILNGSRLKFNGDLSMNLYQEEPKQQLLLPLITESVKVGSITISKDVALPKYLDPPKSKRVGFKKLPEYSIRRFSHVDDLVERVRLQQVDILKKYQAKSFSKDIQNKLKDELFIILKQFE